MYRKSIDLGMAQHNRFPVGGGNVSLDELKKMMEARGKEGSDYIKSTFGSVESLAKKLKTDLVNGKYKKTTY